jgi:DNA-binding MarR family transcriptional regulator
MSVDPAQLPRPLPALMNQVRELALHKMRDRLAEEGYGDIREGYGCVFGFIDIDQGSRLTELAERSGLTKQAVGEVIPELEQLGYVAREPDPRDRRAKIIKLTPKGRDACLTGRRLFADIEREWAEELGEELLAGLREAAERIATAEREKTAHAGTALRM